MAKAGDVEEDEEDEEEEVDLGTESSLAVNSQHRTCNPSRLRPRISVCSTLESFGVVKLSVRRRRLGILSR